MRSGRKFTGKTPLPDCIWKRPCPFCGARQGALCFRPDTNIPMTTEVHYMRRDTYQHSRWKVPADPLEDLRVALGPKGTR